MDPGGLDSVALGRTDDGLMAETEGETTSTTTNGPAPIAVYVYAVDQIIENVTTGHLYFQDSLGNTSHVTDAAGNLLERCTYSAFGIPTFLSANNTQLSTSAYGIKHLFQGQLWTQETGLNDYRNRVELPKMGVFLQPDPIGFKGDAANLYRFCNNNAVNRTDPMGLFSDRGVFLGYGLGEGMEGPGRDLAQRLGMANLKALLDKLLRLATPPEPRAQTPTGRDGPSQRTHVYAGAHVKINHSETFDVTSYPITYNNGKSANAVTAHNLTKPVAVDRDGEIYFSQTLESKTTFPVGASFNLVAAEFKRIAKIREEQNWLQLKAEERSLRNFSSPATRHDYELWAVGTATLFDVFNRDGGTK
jgi:RHS repeat-associated protein